MSNTMPENVVKIFDISRFSHDSLDPNTFFHKFEKKDNYYELSEEYSYQYLIDEEFREKVKGSINDISKQLCLNLIWCNDLKDPSVLKGVHTLRLIHCNDPNFTDASLLGCVHELLLKSCNNITNVSGLGNLDTLILQCCN